jgi:hypothetical protein
MQEFNKTTVSTVLLDAMLKPVLQRNRKLMSLNLSGCSNLTQGSLQVLLHSRLMAIYSGEWTDGAERIVHVQVAQGKMTT